MSHEKKISIAPCNLNSEFSRFRVLGFLCGNMAVKRKKLPFSLDDNILSFLSLEVLPWNLVEPKNKQIF